MVISEWDDYLDHRLSKSVLQYLFLHGSKGSIDSIHNYINGRIHVLKPDSLHIDAGKLNKNKTDKMFAYLDLAKECEKFAVGEYSNWYENPKPSVKILPNLERSLSNAFNTSTDAFIKQRLWFQLTRYYFFNDDTAKRKKLNNQDKILDIYNKYKDAFPKSLTYYRTLGYIAGYYRSKGDYAQANYLYSRCYDYSFEMKIPSKFSFHAQEDTDWQETMKLAKNKEEKITLWHMLGMEYDPVRAIKEIVALDPKSDKIDLLLSRLVNTRESNDYRMYFISHVNYAEDVDNSKLDRNKIVGSEIWLVDSIALKNNTAKPYFWNIAAGYLHYLHGDYVQAGKFYDMAKKLMPTNDKLIIAQHKMLTILLDVSRLPRMDAATEVKLVEPLSWLKDLQEGKENIKDLRVGSCTGVIARLYLRQGDTLKGNCFSDSISFYSDDVRVQQMVDLMNKPNKTPFEKLMLRYYPRNIDELYYFQATLLTYQENIDGAIDLMSKIKKTSPDTLLGNPFNSRLNDCHDCDHDAPQKQKFSPLTFLKTIRSIKADLKAGKDSYRNAWLLANAYYNISYYGNARLFFQSDIIGRTDVEPSYGAFRQVVTSQQAAVKYYLLARTYALNDEQRARCTFMASKCQRNESYSDAYISGTSWDNVAPHAYGSYTEELKSKYSKTKYYKEVLRECGYFSDYVHQK